MKHLIETTVLNSLGFAEYGRLILDSATNEIVYRGGMNMKLYQMNISTMKPTINTIRN